MNVLSKIELEQMRLDIPAFRPGDTVKVHVKIREGEKDRIQVFQGVVIARKNAGDALLIYGAQGFLQRGRGENFPPALAVDRPD